MPYIKPEARRPLDNIVADMDTLIYAPGDLAYVLYSFLLHQSKDSHFAQIAAWRGAVECALQEHYRRFMSQFENAKIRENGDIG
jgi:hypothetical protein